MDPVLGAEVLQTVWSLESCGKQGLVCETLAYV